MASLVAEWPDAIGMEPPPPQTPSCYRAFVRYQGAWNDSMEIEVWGNMQTWNSVPPGEYTVRIYGVYNGEISQAFASETYTITGAVVTPTAGNGPPGGNADIAAPGSLTLSEPS